MNRQASWRTLTRALIFALSMAMVPVLSVHAQESAKKFRIGFLDTGQSLAVPKLLTDMGYIDGQNAVFEHRSSQAEPERAAEMAADLVRNKVDVIIAFTNVNAFAAKQATSTIPIVVWASHGALATGLVSSLARPTSNVTGIESLAPEIDAKRVELLKEIVPGLMRVAALYSPNDQGAPTHLKYTEDAARVLGVHVLPLEVRAPADYDSVFAPLAAKPIGGLVMFTDPLTWANWKRVADFAFANRLPTVCEFRQLAESGCLVSYGPTFDEFDRRVASQVDRILKGKRPADVPYEQVTRFELVINLRTAKSLGMTISPTLLAQADQVIE
jgi:putative ABC transport system substrate-binding protein